MQKYADYVSAPTAWLGDLPAHWKYKKIGALFSERKSKVSDKDYAPLSVARIGVVPQLATAVKTDAGDNRKLVRAGDFVINSRSDRKGSCGVSELDGSVSLINIVLTPRIGLSNGYVHYLLRSHAFSEEYYRNGRGIVADLWTTRYSEMKSILLPIPPREEQEQIVRFLDWKISSIHKLIKIKRKEIQLLAEQQEALITHMTHYGLSKAVSFKETGLAWIGEIPSHWHLRPFSKVANVCTNLVSPIKYLDDMHISPASIEKNTGRIIGTKKVREAGVISNNHKFFEGQLLYSKVRPLLNKVAIAPFAGLCSADMYPIETVLDTRYLKYYMLSQNFLCQLSMTGNRVKMPKINQDELSTVMVAFPEESEQIAIADYLDEACDRIHLLKVAIQEIIDSLQDFKSKLISDVVTGKIDVREIEIPEYELVDEDDEADNENDSEETEEQED